MNRYCGQVSANTLRPRPRALRITATPSAVETWKTMIGWSMSSAKVMSRLMASASEPRGWLMVWYLGAV